MIRGTEEENEVTVNDVVIVIWNNDVKPIIENQQYHFAYNRINKFK